MFNKSNNSFLLPSIEPGQSIRVILPGKRNDSLLVTTITNNIKQTVEISVDNGTIVIGGYTDIDGEISIHEELYTCCVSEVIDESMELSTGARLCAKI